MHADYQALYDSLTGDMAQAQAIMDSTNVSQARHRNALAAYCDARDARRELAYAENPEASDAAEAHRNACAGQDFYHA